MARPMCKLMGVKYPQPLTLDEVPKTEGNRGDRKSYYYVMLESDGFCVSSASDNFRDSMRTCVENGMTHYDAAAAEQQIQAIKAMLRHVSCFAEDKKAKLCGIEFGAPLRLDDVPESDDDNDEDDDASTGEEYYYLSFDHNGFNIEDACDNDRYETRQCVSNNATHWSYEESIKHLEAVKAAIKLANSKAA